MKTETNLMAELNVGFPLLQVGGKYAISSKEPRDACRFSSLWNHPGEDARAPHFAEERALETNYPHPRFTFEEMEPERI